MSDEFEIEPIPGLPELLPAGEVLHWQGSPSWTSLARHSFHATKAAGYFALLLTGRFFWQLSTGEQLIPVLVSALPAIALGACGLALLTLLAWLSARTTIYSITSKRLVMRYGIALPMTVNLPFNEIGAVDMKVYSDGSGDIALKTTGPLQLAYLNLWPNVRPWRLGKAEPALRSVASIKQIAGILAEQLASAGPQSLRANTPARLSTNDNPTPAMATAAA